MKVLTGKYKNQEFFAFAKKQDVENVESCYVNYLHYLHFNLICELYTFLLSLYTFITLGQSVKLRYTHTHT